MQEIYVCYNEPLDFVDNGILLFTVGPEVGPAKEVVRGSTFSDIGESTNADPSITPCALTSSIVDRDGFKTAGVTVGLPPDADLFVPEASDFFILAL